MKILIFEDDANWVGAFKFNIEPKIEEMGHSIVILHKEDDATLMQDLEWLPDLIMIDHDLGSQVGTDIISQIHGDPNYRHSSIFYYSGGETLETLKENAKSFKCVVHCFSKEGEELEAAVLNKCAKLK